ncbi:uncharacterized protein ALTATR162_LOCUS2106 [Alternaria atra]|uniref:Uncharacterized protein n=1 Tax=Alternaria atra TaxID=119953 RepID=A0A8J2N306_9PLEO|nr:uncharacterized protein ALTATR162_LOCUS2106 [Alternaria atra]CAG5147849.1 unnamed protein product [Alternaria atra]
MTIVTIDMVSSNTQSGMTANCKSALSRAVRKLKAAEDTALAHHSGSSHAANVADDTADEHQPDDNENEQDHEDVMAISTQKDTHNRTRPAMVFTDKEAKQRHSDEQVSFIILTRDNNKPDAYGASSETYGPLPWPGVAKAYNEKYGLRVGPAAMEKRARQHRSSWIAKHPTYPINIMYAEKPKAPQVRRSEVLAAKPQGYCVQSSTGKEQVRCTGGFVGADQLQTQAESFQAHVSNDRIGGWVPPDVIRNRADLNKYLDQLRSAQIERFVMEILDAQDLSLGVILADRGDLLQSSSVFQRSMNGNSDVLVQLRCSSIAVVQSYLDCTSVGGLTELPAHLLRDGSSLMRLYCFATQLEDDWVRERILALWRGFAESNAEVNLGLQDLNLLFESTRIGDPARNFWAATVHTAGLSVQLVEMFECNAELIAEIQDVVARASV